MECATGGRLLHWLPYYSYNNNKSVPNDFLYIYSNQTQLANAWRPEQPNNKGPVCLKTYLGEYVIQRIKYVLTVFFLGLGANESW